MVFSPSLATLLLYFFLASAQSALWLDLDQTPNKGLHILLRSAFTTYCKSCLPVCNHLLCYNIYNRAPQTLCTSGRMARSLTGKKTSPNDASYRPQMPSLIDTFHIQLKSREDMRAHRRANLHLHQSHASDRTYEEENEKYDYMNGQISVQNVHIPSLIGCICIRLGNEFANSDRRCSNR